MFEEQESVQFFVLESVAQMYMIWKLINSLSGASAEAFGGIPQEAVWPTATLGPSLILRSGII